jgi:hypothetical protein
MAEDRIESDDVLDPNLFKGIIHDATILHPLLTQLIKDFKSILNIREKSIKENPRKTAEDYSKLAEDVREVNEAYKGLNETKKTQKKVDDELAKAEAKLTKAEADEARQLALLKVQIEQQNKLNKDNAKITLGLIGAYQMASKRLDDLRRQYKDLVTAEGDAADGAKELLDEITQLDAQLKKTDAQVGQFNRNVGNYKNSIKDAIQETGLFNGTLGQVANGLNQFGVGLKNAAKGAGSLGAALKASGIGLILAAVSLLVSAFKSLADTSQEVRDEQEKLEEQARLTAAAQLASGASSAKARAELDKYYESLKLARPEIRALNLELQELTLNLEDQREIYQDSTIGINERKAALASAQALEIQVANKQIELAQKNLDLINQRIAAEEAVSGKGDALEEFYQKQVDATNELKAAQDRLADSTRVQAAENRAIALEEATLAVELLRSKKLGAKEAEQILAKQLDDERKSIDIRRQLAEQLLKTQDATTKEEIKLFKQKTGIQFDAQKLLNETDAVKLANQLKSITQINEEGKAVGIGTDAINLLAKITKQYQDNRIANEEILSKLREEEIAQLNKLADIQRTIQTNQLTADVNRAERELQFLNKVQEKGNEQLLASDSLFQARRAQIRRADIERERQSIDDLFAKKKELLDQNAFNEARAAEASIKNQEVLALELKRIQDKRKLDTEQLLQDQIQAQEDFNEKIAEQDRQLFNKEIDSITAVGNAFFDSLAKRDAARAEATDREISRQQSALETQQRLSEKGLDNTLAFEQKRAAELERKREDQAKKQVRQAELVAFFNLFAEYAKDQPDFALAKSALQIAAAKTLAGLLSAYDGTEDTGTGGNLDEKGGFLAKLHPHERIVPERINKHLSGISNEELGNIVLKYKNGIPDAVGTVDPRVVEEIKGLRKDIQSLNYQVNWNEHGEAVEKTVTNGMIKVVRHLNSKPRI